MSCLQYKNTIIVDKNQSIPYFPPHCGIQCSIPSKVCPLRKRLSLSCHKNSSQIFDATKLWKHTIPLTYNTKTLISNISETHRFSPQMRLIAYPDHKTTLNENSGRIRALSWYLIIAYQCHNNRNNHLNRPESSCVLTHQYLDTITLGVLINNYCYGKYHLRITRDILFC